MVCPRCSHDITEDQAVCPNCHLAFSQAGSSPSLIQQVAIEEPRQTRFIWGGFIAIFVGVLCFFLGGAGGIVIGLFCITCGTATLVVSRFGTRWNTLSRGQKALVYPGWAISIVYVGLLRLAVFIIRAFTQKA